VVVLEVMFVLVSLPLGREISFFYLGKAGVRDDDFSVRSGDSGLDSPEVHGPRGRSVGHSWGVDKLDELFMQLSAEPSCPRCVRGPSLQGPRPIAPVRTQIQTPTLEAQSVLSRKDPDLLRT